MRVLVVADDLRLGVRINEALSADHDVLVVSWPQLALDLLRLGGRWDAILCEPHPKGLEPEEFVREIGRIAGEQAEHVFVVAKDQAASAIRQSIKA